MTYRHGMFGTPTYGSWMAMKQRCYNKKDKMYQSYGGRGIEVCLEWHDFVAFYEDMGDRPEGYELDRVDNNKGYSKNNCRWVDRATNMRNRSNTRITKIGDELLTLKEISVRYNINYNTLKNRWHNGHREDSLLTFQYRRQ